MTMHIGAPCTMVHFFAITALLLINEFPAGNFMEYKQCDFWNRGTWKKIIQPQHFRIIIIIIIK